MPAPLNESSSTAATGQIRIVLVGTQHPGNIGAAARAMKTMGLSRLVLVAPEKALDDWQVKGRSHGVFAPIVQPRVHMLTVWPLVGGCATHLRSVC